MPEHVVVHGDCISSLAAAHGLMPETIWDHPENADLRRQRPDPNVLFPGDVVVIPELRQRNESRPTENRHRFVRKGARATFRLRLIRNGKPRGNRQYELEIDGRTVNGTTDGDGWITAQIPPNARTGVLRLLQSNEAIPLLLGHLDPLDEVEGVQQRLRNLGCYGGPVTSEWDEATNRALRCFQLRQNLAVTGYLDDSTKAALRRAHGG